MIAAPYDSVALKLRGFLYSFLKTLNQKFYVLEFYLKIISLCCADEYVSPKKKQQKLAFYCDISFAAKK